MYRPLPKIGVTFAAWLAIVAMALNALWPLFAQLGPGAAQAPMESRAETAIQHGIAVHPIAGHHAQHDSAPCDPGPLTPHCAFCSLGCAAFAALTAHPLAGVLLVAAEESRPVSIDVRPLALITYPPAQPRAPPVLF